MSENINEISALPANIRDFLAGREELSDMVFLTEFPPVRKAVPLKKVTVAVGIKRVLMEDTFAANDDENVLENNEYCRQTEITLRFSIHAPYAMGGAACHKAFADIIDCLTFDSGLDVTSGGCDAVSEDRETDAFVLKAYAVVKANLCPAQSGGLDFPSFLDKTLLCGSHIRDESIHLSESQRQFLSSPFVAGSYHGSGSSSRTISLGFKPSAVILLAGSLPFFTSENGFNKLYFAAAVTGAGSLGAEITSGGFRVNSGSSYSALGAYPALNESGVIYNYVALR